MMAPRLYADLTSTPCRAVMMVCDALSIPFDLVNVDLANKDQLKDDYLEKNPMHTVPTLEDDDLIIQDSHAIIAYLADKYGNDNSDTWYPKDLKKRALVDQKLYFDALFFTRMIAITNPAFHEGVRNPPKKVISELVQMYEFLELFLARTKYVAGSQMTVADISFIALVSTTNLMIPVDSSKYPKIYAWMKKMEDQAFYLKRNVPGMEKLTLILKKSLDMMN